MSARGYALYSVSPTFLFLPRKLYRYGHAAQRHTEDDVAPSRPSKSVLSGSEELNYA